MTQRCSFKECDKEILDIKDGKAVLFINQIFTFCNECYEHLNKFLKEELREGGTIPVAPAAQPVTIPSFIVNPYPIISNNTPYYNPNTNYPTWTFNVSSNSGNSNSIDFNETFLEEPIDAE